MDSSLNATINAHKIGEQDGIETGIRNGGSIFKYNDSLYRIAQQQLCHDCYGSTVDAFKVLKLSVSEKYEEILMKIFVILLKKKETLGIGIPNVCTMCQSKKFMIHILRKYDHL